LSTYWLRKLIFANELVSFVDKEALKLLEDLFVLLDLVELCLSDDPIPVLFVLTFQCQGFVLENILYDVPKWILALYVMAVNLEVHVLRKVNISVLQKGQETVINVFLKHLFELGRVLCHEC